jgi:hypothetical protein
VSDLKLRARYWPEGSRKWLCECLSGEVEWGDRENDDDNGSGGALNGCVSCGGVNGVWLIEEMMVMVMVMMMLMSRK